MQWNTMQPSKGRNPVSHYNIDGPQGHYSQRPGQLQNDKYCMVPFMWSIQGGQNHRNRK